MKLRFAVMTRVLLCVGSLITGCDDNESPSASQPPSLHWEVTSLSAGKALAIAVNNVGTVFASIDGDGIYKSTDHGTTWTKPMTGPFQGSTGDGYALHFLVDGFTLWAGTENAGIHRSTDEGANWQEVPANVPMGMVFDLCLARGSVFCASDSGIYVLTQADQWKRINPSPVRAVCGDHQSNSLYAGGRIEFNFYYHAATILWSPEKQGGWYTEVVSSGDWVNALAQAPNGNHYAGSEMGGMLRRRAQDLWWSWEPIGTSDYNVWAIAGIVIAPNNHVFVFTGPFVYRSTDDGVSWNWCSEGLTGDHVLALAINPAGYMFAGTHDGVFRTRY